MKYSVFKLPEDTGKTKLAPIANMIALLENDSTLSCEEKLANAIYVATELNVSNIDIKYAYHNIYARYDHICNILLSDKENVIRKTRDFLFHGRLNTTPKC